MKKNVKEKNEIAVLGRKMAIKQYSNKNVAVLKKLDAIKKEQDIKLIRIYYEALESKDWTIIAIGLSYLFLSITIIYTLDKADLYIKLFALLGFILLVSGMIGMFYHRYKCRKKLKILKL